MSGLERTPVGETRVKDKAKNSWSAQSNTGSDKVEAIVNSLGGKRQGKGWICPCPAHDDQNPSLSVSVGDNGKILVNCHAGCLSLSVISALKG